MFLVCLFGATPAALDAIKQKRTSEIVQYKREAVIGKGRAAEVHMVKKDGSSPTDGFYAMKVRKVVPHNHSFVSCHLSPALLDRLCTYRRV